MIISSNPPPAEDGIHDPVNDGTLMLQPPKEAFSVLPKSSSGNYIDWVKALNAGKIAPRYDRLDPKAEPIVMDLDIVREVTGVDIPVEIHPRRAGDPAMLVADITRARVELGWKPEYSTLKEIIESAWKWMKEHPDGYEY